jgi:hypothetical protein
MRLVNSIFLRNCGQLPKQMLPGLRMAKFSREQHGDETGYRLHQFNRVRRELAGTAKFGIGDDRIAAGWCHIAFQEIGASSDYVSADDVHILRERLDHLAGAAKRLPRQRWQSRKVRNQLINRPRRRRIFPDTLILTPPGAHVPSAGF